MSVANRINITVINGFITRDLFLSFSLTHFCSRVRRAGLLALALGAAKMGIILD